MPERYISLSRYGESLKALPYEEIDEHQRAIWLETVVQYMLDDVVRTHKRELFCFSIVWQQHVGFSLLVHRDFGGAFGIGSTLVFSGPC